MMHPLDVLATNIPQVAPGAQLAASIGGRRLVSEALGRTAPDGTAVSVNTAFDLASLTKPLATSLFLARAVSEGRCRLSDPVSDHFRAALHPHRLRDLAEHCAGLPAHLRLDRLLPRWITPGTQAASDWILAEVGRLAPEHPARQEAVYSDLGYILLGAALERMFGRRLTDLQDELFPSLFFQSTRSHPPPAALAQHFAETEGGLCGQVHDENCRAMGGVAGHAGLFGSAEEVLSLAERLLDAYHNGNNPILPREAIEELWRPSSVPGSTRTLGWDRPSPGGSTGDAWPAHAVGHLGFTGTSLWIDPERSLAVVLLTNRVCPSRAHPEGIRALRRELYAAAWEHWTAPRSRHRRATTQLPPKAPLPPREETCPSKR